MSAELRVAIAEALVDAGVPWHVAYCGCCGAPVPSAGHVCAPRPAPKLLGIRAAVGLDLLADRPSDLP